MFRGAAKQRAQNPSPYMLINSGLTQRPGIRRIIRMLNGPARLGRAESDSGTREQVHHPGERPGRAPYRSWERYPAQQEAHSPQSQCGGPNPPWGASWGPREPSRTRTLGAARRCTKTECERVTFLGWERSRQSAAVRILIWIGSQTSARPDASETAIRSLQKRVYPLSFRLRHSFPY
jgi:hypothetical protein